jgi:uncharacterized protein DUF1707/uncharacterized protein DUF4190
MAAPGQWAGGDARRLRAADADRERAIEVLKTAFTDGRLTKDEYDERVAGVYSSRTYADLSVLTSDLPGPPGSTPAVRPPAYSPVPGRPPANSLAVASLCCGIAEFFTGGLSAIPAVVCGHIARSQIRRTGEPGAGLALVGLVLGWCGVLVWALVVIIGLLIFSTS